jgi:hypothetical protein
MSAPKITKSPLLRAYAIVGVVLLAGASFLVAKDGRWDAVPMLVEIELFYIAIGFLLISGRPTKVRMAPIVFPIFIVGVCIVLHAIATSPPLVVLAAIDIATFILAFAVALYKHRTELFS